jgi:hypothetical protein
MLIPFPFLPYIYKLSCGRPGRPPSLSVHTAPCQVREEYKIGNLIVGCNGTEMKDNSKQFLELYSRSLLKQQSANNGTKPRNLVNQDEF